MSFAENLRQEVLVLAEGELIAQGAPGEVRADARVRDVYLGEGMDRA